MSSFNSFGLFMVVGILYIYVRFFLDRLVRDRADAVVTGVIRAATSVDISKIDVRNCDTPVIKDEIALPYSPS